MEQNNWQLIIEKEKKNKTGILNLSDQSLTNIPHEIWEMTWLNELDLRFNQISKIEGLEKLSNLYELDLSFNQISKIEGLDNLVNLSTLYLYKNHIRKIEGIDKLINLVILDLSDNQITNIEGVEKLINLSGLKLSTNPISKIEGLDNLINLSKLYLSENKICKIEDTVEIERFLSYEDFKIDLKGNPLFKVEPFSIELLKEKLNKIPTETKRIEIEKNRKTGLLDLNKLGLYEIPKEVNQLTWLHTLLLKNNYIIKIENIDKLTELKVLKFAYNYIIKIENLETNTKLTYLTLRQNGIKIIEGLENLTELNRLNLSNNQITSILPLKSFLEKGMQISIHQSFDEKDTGIYIADNPLGHPPAEIIAQGFKSILNYFDSLDKSGNDSHHYKNKFFKIILVGNSEAGKSEFVKKFINSNKKNVTSTHYLEIEEWKGNDIKKQFPLATNVADDATAFVYDFGGQEYYHDTHKIYFTNKTIYLLFWENKTNDYIKLPSNREDSDEVIQHYPLEYWLESIAFLLRNRKIEKPNEVTNKLKENDEENVVKDNVFRDFNESDTLGNVNTSSPILIIENKIDLNNNRNTKLNQTALESICGHIYDFSSVSLLNEIKLSQFKNDFSDIVNYLNPSEDVLQLYYEPIIEYIQNLQTKKESKIILSKNEFLEDVHSLLGVDYVLTKLDIESLLDYLSQKGIIIYVSNFFNKNKEDNELIPNIIDELIIIKPEEFRKQTHDLFEVVKKNEGKFTKQTLTDLKIQEEAILFLEYFKVVFTLDDNKQFVAPVYLPTKPESIVEILLENLPTPIRRFLFSGYIHKTIIMDVFSQLNDKENYFHYYWRDGIIISKRDSKNQKIYISFVNEEIKTTTAKTNCKCYIDVFVLKDEKESTFVSDIIRIIKQITYNWSVIELVTANGIDFICFKILNKKAESELLQIEYDNVIFKVADLNKFLNKPLKMKKIFISYAEEDNQYREILDAYLSTLKRQGLISVWHDRKIIGGTNWHAEIQKNIQEADIILCLITPNYFKESKTYIWSVEIPAICEKLNKKENSVIPIVINNTPGWNKVPIGKNERQEVIKFGEPNGLPKKKYIQHQDYKNETDAWADVSNGIKEAIEKLDN